jgi:hypothetical protein
MSASGRKRTVKNFKSHTEKKALHNVEPFLGLWRAGQDESSDPVWSLASVPSLTASGKRALKDLSVGSVERTTTTGRLTAETLFHG